MQARGRNITLILGGGVAALALVAALEWKEIASWHHLGRLKGEPEFLRAMLEKDQSVAERLAIHRFLKTRAGKEALFRVYFGEWMALLTRRHVTLSSVRERGKGLVRLKESFVALEIPPVNGDVTGSHSAGLEEEGRSRRRGILEFIPALAGETFKSPEEPGLRFRVLHRDQALRAFHGNGFDISGTAGLEDYMCVIERME